MPAIMAMLLCPAMTSVPILAPTSCDATPARYIRLYTTKLSYSSTVNGGYAIEMSEMEVYGTEHISDGSPFL
jgi:hypothetical protein